MNIVTFDGVHHAESVLGHHYVLAAIVGRYPGQAERDDAVDLSHFDESSPPTPCPNRI